MTGPITLPRIGDTELNAFSVIVHDGNLRRGFAQAPSTDDEKFRQAITVALALIITEADEALDEVDASRPLDVNLYRASDNKPEGFPSEIADIVIRILDLSGRWKFDIASAFAEADAVSSGFTASHAYLSVAVKESLVSLIRDFAKIIELVRSGEDEQTVVMLGRALSATYRIAELAGFDLDQVIDEKLAFNETRAYKHGKTF